MTATGPSRRCWRCIETFPCDAADVPDGAPMWWLCDPCHEKLIGSNSPGRGDRGRG